MKKRIKRWWLRHIIKKKPSNWKRVIKRNNLEPSRDKLPKCSDGLPIPFWEFISKALRDEEIYYYVNASAVEILILGIYNYHITLWKGSPSLELEEYYRYGKDKFTIYKCLGDIPRKDIRDNLLRLKRIAFAEYFFYFFDK